MSDRVSKKAKEFENLLSTFGNSEDHKCLLDSKVEFLKDRNVIRVTLDFTVHPPASKEAEREAYFVLKGLAKSLGLSSPEEFDKVSEFNFVDFEFNS